MISKVDEQNKLTPELLNQINKFIDDINNNNNNLKYDRNTIKEIYKQLINTLNNPTNIKSINNNTHSLFCVLYMLASKEPEKYIDLVRNILLNENLSIPRNFNKNKNFINLKVQEYMLNSLKIRFDNNNFKSFKGLSAAQMAELMKTFSSLDIREIGVTPGASSFNAVVNTLNDGQEVIVKLKKGEVILKSIDENNNIKYFDPNSKKEKIISLNVLQSEIRSAILPKEKVQNIPQSDEEKLRVNEISQSHSSYLPNKLKDFFSFGRWSISSTSVGFSTAKLAGSTIAKTVSRTGIVPIVGSVVGGIGIILDTHDVITNSKKMKNLDERKHYLEDHKRKVEETLKNIDNEINKVKENIEKNPENKDLKLKLQELESTKVKFDIQKAKLYEETKKINEVSGKRKKRFWLKIPNMGVSIASVAIGITTTLATFGIGAPIGMGLTLAGISLGVSGTTMGIVGYKMSKDIEKSEKDIKDITKRRYNSIENIINKDTREELNKLFDSGKLSVDIDNVLFNQIENIVYSNINQIVLKKFLELLNNDKIYQHLKNNKGNPNKLFDEIKNIVINKDINPELLTKFLELLNNDKISTLKKR